MVLAPDTSQSRIAFIPARGGSKRVPRKNIREFAGQPMISWPIAAALHSGKFDSVIVSTDDDEIAHVSAGFGAQVVYRDLQLADDFSHTTEVLKDFIRRAVSPEANPWIYKIYPTAPVTPRVLEDFILCTEARDSGLVVSVTQARNPVQRALVMDSHKVLRFREPEFALTRSQDLDPILFDAGKIYGGRKQDWIETDNPLLSAPRGFVLPTWLSVDIDSSEDWEIAECIYKRRFALN